MFSALIPVYNHAAFVAEAVLSALASPLVTEVLVIDDGSTDGSREVLRHLAGADPRLRDLTPVEGGNAGAHVRLNQLVHAASNEWVAVLNSDDRFLAGRFELCRQLIRTDAPDLICGQLVIIDQTGRPLGTKRGPLEPEYPYPQGVDVARRLTAGDLLGLLANQNFVATTSNMVFTRSLHRVLGGFADYRYAHDYEFILRACLLGRVTFVPHYLTAYRIHRSNTISEAGSIERTRAEVRLILDRLVADFPFLRETGDFARLAAARPW